MTGKEIRSRRWPKLVIAGAVLLMVGCGTGIPSGHHGVKYFKFGGGTELGKVYPEGFQWHLPWNSMFVYKTQLSERKENLTVLSSDGATIDIEVSMWYRPEVSKLDSLQIMVGPHYYDVVVAPAIRSQAREIAGKYKPEEIYSSKREQVAAEVLTSIRKLLDDKFITVENVIFRNVLLPAKITEAINEKLAAQQAAQRMEFVLDRERREAERKRIEAQGIADFQKIVSSGLTADLLRWKGIEATQTLAESPNTKIVIVGNSKDGLPLILGGN